MAETYNGQMGLMVENYFTSPGVLEATGLPVPGLWLLTQGWLVPRAQLQGVLCSHPFSHTNQQDCPAVLDLIEGLFQLESCPEA